MKVTISSKIRYPKDLYINPSKIKGIYMGSTIPSSTIEIPKSIPSTNLLSSTFSLIDCHVKNLRSLNIANIQEFLKDPNNVYIGRHNRIMCNSQMIYIHESPFSNPFKVGKDGDLKTVLTKYYQYMQEKLRNDPELRKKLVEISGKRWGCWCVNSQNCFENVVCHGQILGQLLKEL